MDRKKSGVKEEWRDKDKRKNGVMGGRIKWNWNNIKEGDKWKKKKRERKERRYWDR